MYVSKQYINEKLNNVRWDIDSMLSQTPDDNVPDDVLDRYAYEIVDNLKALEKEIGKALK